jgi:hypothetical protein
MEGSVQDVQEELAQCVRANTANLNADVANAFFDADARLDGSIFIDPTITVNGEQARPPPP